MSLFYVYSVLQVHCITWLSAVSGCTFSFIIEKNTKLWLWTILFLSYSIIFIQEMEVCIEVERLEMKEKPLLSLNFTGSNSIFASANLPPSSESVGFSLFNWSASTWLLSVRLQPAHSQRSPSSSCVLWYGESLILTVFLMCPFSFSGFQSVSCGSLHQLGEEQLKPPPLPPRRKDAMSEAKVRA